MSIPKPPIVTGTIKQVKVDTCWIELEKGLGTGILRQEESLAYNDSLPLNKLKNYKVGNEIQVYLKRIQTNSNKWYVNERWVKNNPWLNLKLKRRDEITGTVVRALKGGYFVKLDNLDLIEVWLPESYIPWQDGSLGNEPSKIGISKLLLETDDKIKAIVTEIKFPPFNPIISLSKYLIKQVRSEKTIKTTKPFSNPLRYAAYIKGDLGIFQRQLVEEKKALLGKKILVVDDDKLALKALIELIKANGAIVESIHVEDGVNDEIISTLHNIVKRQNFDLILIDYSLPSQGEGLQLACELNERISEQPIVLFTGDRLAKLPNDSKFIRGFLRRPLQLDKILACLTGKKKYWEVGSDESLIAQANEFDNKINVFKLLDDTIQKYGLKYGVLIKILTQHHLEIVYQTGSKRFPTEPHELEHLLLTSDLRQLVKEFKIELQLKPNTHGNDGLRPYSRYARFLTLGEPPGYILGLGWDGDEKFKHDYDLQAFSLLIYTLLEHKSLQEWLHIQLPFLVQGQLLNGLTHEIRGRFSPWLNYQQALHDLWQQYKYCEPSKKLVLEHSIDEALTGIGKSYDNLDELMNLMLGGFKQSGTNTKIKTLLEQIKVLFTGHLRQHSILLQVESAPDITLSFSPLYLLQPLSNLILNSCKHMHLSNGGKIIVTTEFDTVDNQNVLAINVIDNGPGIPASFEKQIFKPGFSLATEQEERTGMGLYISKLLLHQIDGDVELIENWRGIGCSFRLYFPLVIGD